MNKKTIKDDKVIIGGIKQSILILNPDSSKPILLIVHGGPGSPDRPLVCKYNKELIKSYTVVCWDQRCAGLSYTKESRKTSLTTELMLSDLKEVVEYLLQRFKQEKLYLAGHSWGAYLGLWFASKYPQYLHYYIGTGQGISSRLDECEKYNFVLGEAIKNNDVKVIELLKYFGVSQNGIYEKESDKAQKFIGKLIHDYGGYIYPNSKFTMTKYILLYPRYYGFNTYRVISGINYSVRYLTPKMKENDVISKITSLSVPILLVFGENDYICPVATAKEWFNKLNAPKKNFEIIKNAAHMVNFEQPEKWNDLIVSCLS